MDSEAPSYVGTPDQTKGVLHAELWFAGQLTPSSSAAIAQAAATSSDVIAVLQRVPQSELQALRDALEPI